MKRKVMAMVLALTMTTGVLAGCGGYGSSKGSDTTDTSTTTETQGSDNSTTAKTQESTATGDPILIGALYPLTGDLADSGKNMQYGIDFAVEEINANGGIDGRPIKIIYGDTQGDGAPGMTEMERLITQEKVVAVMGAYQSGVTEVVSQVAENYQIPMITANATADSLTSHGYEYFFRLAPTNMMFIRDMFQCLVDYAGKHSNATIKTVAVCADNTELGQQTATWAKFWAEKNGMEYLGDVLYSKGAADLTSEVLQLKQLNPDALIVDNYVSDAILLTKTMNEQGYKPQIMIAKGNGYSETSYLESTGAQANGILFATEYLQGEKSQDIYDRFMQKYNVALNGHSAEAYTVVWIFKQALQNLANAGKEINSENLKTELQTIKIENSFEGGSEIILPYNTIQFTDGEFNGIQYKQTNMLGNLVVAQFQDEEIKSVWPFDEAEVEIQYPASFQ
ncbi:amino acid/amide ABC transporter substrate-binding protein (HAAT family) [Lachnotalea glycerini]|uniref:Amino acid/amide ABC transporter substrate-binding protein (HAAT family) n=1 Tax=Lachnotalea glycerini TaxID=1763509 RepID=A0A318ESS4_9FIRM|nr:ABC transporter substrate-binding protein [Lachnotalea glycerini]PXV91617.1 amino acid/amide ABC transporter substrate-binding protein (HAAT family) [Lachnotalea glycerini]